MKAPKNPPDDQREAIRLARVAKKKAYDAIYRQQHKQRKAEQSKAWAAANPDRLLQRRAAWRQRNREAVNAYHREWYAENTDAAKAYRRRFLSTEQGREYAIRNAAKRRAALLNVTSAVTSNDIRAIKITAAGQCAYCLKPATKSELEHCTPLSRGGGHDIDNLVVACRSCNRRKHSKTVLEFCFDLTQTT